MVFDLQLWLVVCPYHAKSEVLSISSWITLKATRQQFLRDADGFCYLGLVRTPILSDNSLLFYLSLCIQ